MRLLLRGGEVEWLLRTQWVVSRGNKKVLGTQDVSQGFGFSNCVDTSDVLELVYTDSQEQTVSCPNSIFGVGNIYTTEISKCYKSVFCFVFF